MTLPRLAGTGELGDRRARIGEAAIREYWIVDPEAETVTVLRLDGDRYAEHGAFARGQTAVSAAYDGLAVDVATLLDAE